MIPQPARHVASPSPSLCRGRICLLIFIFPVPYFSVLIVSIFSFESSFPWLTTTHILHPTSLLASDRMNVILSIDRQTHCHGSRLSNGRDWFPFAGRRGPSSALSSKKERQDKTRCRDLKMKQGSVTGLVDLSQSDLQVFKSHPRPKNALIGLVPE